MPKPEIQIASLGKTNISQIVECLTASFKNYFVKMPSEVDFWRKRFNAARVDYDLSIGCFDDGKLIAFIIHGIDIHNGEKTAFNTGTGVMEDYRGQKLVDKMYDFVFPNLRKNGITKCMLEVIDENERAIRVYERIGFKKDRFLRCYKGEAKKVMVDTNVEEIDISDIKSRINHYQKFYSWDNALNAILTGGKMFSTYMIKNLDSEDLGYMVINNTNDALIQLEAFDDKHWMDVLGSVHKVIPNIRINNVDDDRKLAIKIFNNSKLENHINQYEMLLKL